MDIHTERKMLKEVPLLWSSEEEDVTIRMPHMRRAQRVARLAWWVPAVSGPCSCQGSHGEDRLPVLWRSDEQESLRKSCCNFQQPNLIWEALSISLHCPSAHVLFVLHSPQFHILRKAVDLPLKRGTWSPSDPWRMMRCRGTPLTEVLGQRLSLMSTLPCDPSGWGPHEYPHWSGGWDWPEMVSPRTAKE